MSADYHVYVERWLGKHLSQGVFIKIRIEIWISTQLLYDKLFLIRIIRQRAFLVTWKVLIKNRKSLDYILLSSVIHNHTWGFSRIPEYHKRKLLIRTLLEDKTFISAVNVKMQMTLWFMKSLKNFCLRPKIRDYHHQQKALCRDHGTHRIGLA